MVGIILFIVVFVQMICLCVWYLGAASGEQAKLTRMRTTFKDNLSVPVFAIMMICLGGTIMSFCLFVYSPVQYNCEYERNKIQKEIARVDSDRAIFSEDTYLQIYKDIKEYNTNLHYLKEHYGNAWNGVFIDEDVLTAQEIPMPEWLQGFE